MTTGKTIALTRWSFVGKVMSLLLNMLSRLVITFLPGSKHLLISWLQSPSAVILEPPKTKVWHCFHCFPIYFPWSDVGCYFHNKWSNLNLIKVDKRWTFKEHLHHHWVLESVVSLNLYNYPLMQVLSDPFCRCENWWQEWLYSILLSHHTTSKY